MAAHRANCTSSTHRFIATGWESISRDGALRSCSAILVSIGQFALGLGLVGPRRWAPSKTQRVAAGVVAGIGLFILGQKYPYSVPFWDDVGRGLPFIPLAGLVGGWMLRRRFPTQALAAWIFSSLALVLLMKMALNARLDHYGFVLAAPAASLGIAIALGWLPALIERAGGGGMVVRIGLTGALLNVAVWLLSAGSYRLAEHTVPIDTPFGSIYSSPEGSTGHRCGPICLERNFPETATVAVIFDAAAGLQLIAERPNPTPYDILHPMALAMNGEERILKAYVRAKPDAIILLDQNTREFGSSTFGETYAAEFSRWIDEQYIRTDSGTSTAPHSRTLSLIQRSQRSEMNQI